MGATKWAFDMTIVCMIPIRAGSKRLPRKNYLPLGDSTVAEQCISKALNSGRYDKVVVNTDDEELKSLESKYGIECYVRDKHLAGDDASSDEVVLDFMSRFPSEVVVWQNTICPFLQVEHIQQFVDEFVKSKQLSAVTVNVARVHALKGGVPINFSFSDSSGFAKTQDLETVTLFNYGLMAWKSEFVTELKKRVLFDNNTLLYETTPLTSVLLKHPSDYEAIKNAYR